MILEQLNPLIRELQNIQIILGIGLSAVCLFLIAIVVKK